MKSVLITGSDGFIGKNLVSKLSINNNFRILKFSKKNTLSDLEEYIKKSDYIFHLAGVNRPEDDREFDDINFGLTKNIADILMKNPRSGKKIIFSSSNQVNNNNNYGKSKKKAEDILISLEQNSNMNVFIFRLPNVFGKWSKPFYNSVVSTFCYNISRERDIIISDKNAKLDLVYIDDVIAAFNDILEGKQKDIQFREIKRVSHILLGELAAKINRIHKSYKEQIVLNQSDYLAKCLNSTYLYFKKSDTLYKQLNVKVDNRGSLVEIIKTETAGQIFISKTKSDIERGNHYHNRKVEKFCVIDGDGEIKLRDIYSNDVYIFKVSGEKTGIVDIPPGFTHSIKNIGKRDMITLFWVNEIFDPKTPDTDYLEV